MKTVILLLALAACMAFAGCGYVYGPVKESEAFANDKADVIEQMIKKIQASPTVAGVDEARKIFEAKKAGLIARRDAIKASPKGINNNWDLTLGVIEDRQEKIMDDAGIKLSVDCQYPCPDVTSKYGALKKDFMDATKRD